MQSKSMILIALCCVAPVFGADAAVSKCSKTNLTRCMDSACAINIGVNPAARCQYCGTSNAGKPPTQKGLTNVTAGQSTKYALTSKDLTNAPSDPEKRYNWAANECIKKLPDCTADDVSDAYDKLIEQSCKAAGATIQIQKVSASMGKAPSRKTCETNLRTCTTKKCGSNYESCQTDTDIDRIISECMLETPGCDAYIADLRRSIQDARDSADAIAEDALRAVVEKRQKERAAKLDAPSRDCNGKAAQKTCISQICAGLDGKCGGTDARAETAIATELCKYHETACNAANVNKPIKETKNNPTPAKKKTTQR